jgi:hypothetical protein
MNIYFAHLYLCYNIVAVSVTIPVQLINTLSLIMVVSEESL